MPSSEKPYLLIQEHEDFLRLEDRLAAALDLAASEDFEVRQRGLAELRGMRPDLLGVIRHCCRDAARPQFLTPANEEREQPDQIETQHAALQGLVMSFLRELLYATADSISESVPMGQKLLEQLGQHTSCEIDLLNFEDDLCSVTA